MNGVDARLTLCVRPIIHPPVRPSSHLRLWACPPPPPFLPPLGHGTTPTAMVRSTTSCAWRWAGRRACARATTAVPSPSSRPPSRRRVSEWWMGGLRTQAMAENTCTVCYSAADLVPYWSCCGPRSSPDAPSASAAPRMRNCRHTACLRTNDLPPVVFPAAFPGYVVIGTRRWRSAHAGHRAQPAGHGVLQREKVLPPHSLPARTAPLASLLVMCLLADLGTSYSLGYPPH